MRKLRQSGYSLIEALVVLVVIASVGAIATALVVRPGGASRVETTALDIQSLLRRTRTEALTLSRPRSVRFDLGARTYGAEGTPALTTLPPGIGLDITTAAAAIDGARSVRLTFEADGSTPGARVVVSDSNTGGVRLTIDVDWLSGRVSLQRPGGA